MGYSLKDLCLARDNNSTAPFNLKPTGGSGAYKISDYQVSSASLSGNQIPLFDNSYDYTITLSGISKKGDLVTSARLNISDVSCGNHTTVSITNTTIRILFDGTDVNVTLYMNWSDTFNPLRNATLAISVG